MNAENPPLLPASVTSFHDYFKLGAEPDDVAAAFGYTFEVGALSLPYADRVPPWADDLRARFARWLPFIRLGNEAGRRETMVAPILLEVVAYLKLRLSIEYNINVAPQLKGRLDYLVRAPRSLLVVEAKDGDMGHGVAQLVAEMIALDKWHKSGSRVLWGAITSGMLWYFAILDRDTKIITQDLLQGFTILGDLGDLVQTLLGILKDKTTDATF